jgi:hypothetical protein
MPETFSEKHPTLQMAWDATSLKALQFCPRNYQLSVLERWGSDSVHKSFGKYLAKGLEIFWKERLNGATIEEALVPAVREIGLLTLNPDGSQWGGQFVTSWHCLGETPYKNDKGNHAKCPFSHKGKWFPGEASDICGRCGSECETVVRYEPDSPLKHRISLIRAIIWYGLSQPDVLTDGLTPFLFENGKPSVEFSFYLPLDMHAYTGETYALCGHMDLVVHFGEETWVQDTKSTGHALDQRFWRGYHPETQFDIYDSVGGIIFQSMNFKGTIVDAIQLTSDGVNIVRRPMPSSEDQRAETWDDVKEWIRLAEQYARADYWPMNKRNCWLCEFNEICALPRSQREWTLKANPKFVQRPARWNPAQER